MRRLDRRIVAGVISVFALTIGSCKESNELPVIPLGAPDATLAEPLARVISVRELSDGRVLISDNKENRLVVGDFAKNVSTNIGRIGNGPGEYSKLGRLWPIGGDTTLMVEPYQNRWQTIVGDSIVQTQSDVGAQRVMLIANLIGANARREVFARARSRDANRARSRADSFPIVRLGWDGSRIDTVGHIAPVKQDKLPEEPVAAARIGGGTRSARETHVILIQALDQFFANADGSYGIVRGDPYRVEQCDAQMKCVAGPILSGSRPKMTTKDRDAYRTVLVRAGRSDARPQDIFEGWPAKIPPFHTEEGPDGGSVWATAHGNIVIERMPTAATPTYSYDVIEKRGNRAATVSVPLGQFVIGFGAKSVYTVRVDDNGVQFLERHPWAY